MAPILSSVFKGSGAKTGENVPTRSTLFVQEAKLLSYYGIPISRAVWILMDNQSGMLW